MRDTMRVLWYKIRERAFDAWCDVKWWFKYEWREVFFWIISISRALALLGLLYVGCESVDRRVKIDAQRDATCVAECISVGQGFVKWHYQEDQLSCVCDPTKTIVRPGDSDKEVTP